MTDFHVDPLETFREIRETIREVGENFGRLKSGLLVPPELVPPSRPLGFDLFAGAGGFSLGMVQAGWHVIAANEWSTDASLTYLVNLGSHETVICFIDAESKARWIKDSKKKWWVDVDRWGSGWIKEHNRKAKDPVPPCEYFFFGDIRQLKTQDVLTVMGMEVGQLDCIFGGPPCQGFSTMGRRQVADPRNNLVFEFCRMIWELQPKTMVMENVPGLLSMVTPEGIPVLDAIAMMLEKGGWGSYEGIRKSLGGMPGARAAVNAKAKGEKAAVPPKSKQRELPFFDRGKLVE